MECCFASEAEPTLVLAVVSITFDDERFNIYIEYEYIDCYFSADSVEIPSEDGAFGELRNFVMAPDYPTGYVRTIGGTFSTVTEVTLAEAPTAVPPAPTALPLSTRPKRRDRLQHAVIRQLCDLIGWSGAAYRLTG